MTKWSNPISTNLRDLNVIRSIWGERVTYDDRADVYISHDGTNVYSSDDICRINRWDDAKRSTTMEETCNQCGEEAPVHLKSCQQAYLYQDAIFKERPTSPHYQQGSIEPIDFISSHGMCFKTGNVIKYVTRFRHKGKPLADLLKARVYLNWLIEEEERKCE